MTGTSDSSTERQQQEAIVAAVAAHMQTRFTEHATHDGRAAFLERVDAGPKRPWIGLALFATACIAAFFLLPRSLTVVAKDVSLDQQQHFKVGGGPAELVFSDGSRATLEPGSAGALSRLDSHGADVHLATGQIDLAVKKRSGARWSVTAGPYKVRVTGTRFQVRWLAQSGRFRIQMWEGRVVVEGPGLVSGRAMSAGESLELPIVPVSVPQEEPIAKAPPAPALSPTAPPAPPRPVRTRATQPAVARNWPAFVAEGKYQSVLAEAGRNGLAKVLKHASIEELAALADAARYGGNADIAEQALLAQRRRFPGGERAVMAAYLLGRLAEDAGQPKSAVDWYDRYLRTRANGALAEESLGRKMLALERAGLLDAARMTAAAYRRQYPSGSFFNAARRIEAIHSP